VLLVLGGPPDAVSAQTQTLVCGSALTGELSTGKVDRFTFTVQALDAVSIRLVNLDDLENGGVAHVLRDPQGGLLDEACGSGIALPLAQGGTYEFEVAPCASSEGIRYALTFAPVSATFNGQPSCARPLSCGDPLLEAALGLGNTDAYALDIEQPGNVSISAWEGNAELGLLQLRVFSPEGSNLADTCDGFVDVLLEPGVHTILVNDCVGAASGPYSIALGAPDCRLGAPPNDACANATVIESPIFRDIVDATAAFSERTDPIPSCALQSRQSVWYQFTAPSDGTVSVDTQGSTFDTVLAAYTGGCAVPLEVAGACNDDHKSLQSRIVFDVTAGMTYLVQASAFAQGSLLLLNSSFTDAGGPPTPTPTPGVGDCCEAHGARGCSLTDCESCVCPIDSFCCREGWDEFCAEDAFAFCNTECGGCGPTPTPTFRPGTGDCCSEHGETGCESAACQECVCDDDPVCCLQGWDRVCAGRAQGRCVEACACSNQPTPTPPAFCPGDCDQDGAVTVDEILFAVSVSLGLAPLEGCSHADSDGDGQVQVNEVIQAVNAALGTLAC
jgi:hypothetical protein